MNRKTQLKIAEVVCGCGTTTAVIATIASFITFMWLTVGTTSTAEANGAFGWWWARWSTGMTVSFIIGLAVAGITLLVVKTLEGSKETVQPSFQNSVTAVIDCLASLAAIPTILTVFWWMMYL